MSTTESAGKMPDAREEALVVIGAIGKSKRHPILLATFDHHFFAVVPLRVKEGDTIGKAWKRELERLAEKIGRQG